MFLLAKRIILVVATIFALVPISESLETLCRDCKNGGITFTFDSPKGHFIARADSCFCNSKQNVKSQDNTVVFEDVGDSSFVMNTRNWARKCEQWSQNTPCCIFE